MSTISLYKVVLHISTYLYLLLYLVAAVGAGEVDNQPLQSCATHIYTSVLTAVLGGCATHIYTSVLTAVLGGCATQIFTSVLTAVLGGCATHIYISVLTAVLGGCSWSW